MREIQSLARGLQIIDLIINMQRPVTITEIASILDVDKSTASRLVGTLENYNYLQQSPNSRAYTIGKRLHSIGWNITNRYSLRELAKPYLHQLTDSTGECAHIGVYSSGKALVTDDVQPENTLLRVVGSTGRHIYLHNTAVGKVLIAFGDFPLPEELPRITPRTITSMTELRKELEQIQDQGFALDDEENEPGVRCIASPVYDSMGVAVASIGISGPTVRVTSDKIQPLADAIIDVACKLSREMGYEGDYPSSAPVIQLESTVN